MSTSSDKTLNLAGVDTANENGTEAQPREEPYLERAHLNKPILDVYDGEQGVSLDRVLLEEPDSCDAWVQTHKNALVDVEAQR